MTMLGVALVAVVALTAVFSVIALADDEAAGTLGIAYLCAITTVSLLYDVHNGRKKR